MKKKISVLILLTGMFLYTGTLFIQAQVRENETAIKDSVSQENDISDQEGSDESSVQDVPVSRQEIQGIRTEIETLREQWKRTISGDYGTDTKVPTTSRSLAINGIIQSRFTRTDTKNSFDVVSGILSFNGSLNRDYEKGRNLNYSLSFISSPSDYTIKPLEVSVSYAILPTLDLEGNFLSISLGQQKKTFSLEALATEEKKPTIKSAQFASKLGLDPREVGLVLKGDLFPSVDYGYGYRVPLFEYSVGLFNGNGSNLTDDNKAKDISARLAVNVVSDYYSIWRGTSLGVSYYKGTRTAALGTGATAISRNGAKDRIGFDLNYVQTPIGITAEYVQGKDAALSGTVAAPVFSTNKSTGYTVTFFYNFGEQFVRGFKNQDRYDDWYPSTLQTFVRFDRWDANKNITGDRVDIITLGLNWFFAETTKLQFNYNIVKEEINEIKNDELLVQIQYGF
jgi:hypothetical protein